MNFTDLYKKINDIDSGTINECSCGEPGPEPQKQQDNVNMNITINGQGSGGIRDLMDILRHIDEPSSHEPHGDDKVIVSEPSSEIEPIRIDATSEEIVPESEPEVIEYQSSEEIIDDSFANSTQDNIDPMKYAIASVIATGDDLSSKGKGALKANGGENPWNVNESLVKHLKDLYEEVKKKTINEGRDGNYDLPGPGDVETWPRNIKSRPSQGVAKYHSDHEEPEYNQPERKDKPEVKWDNSKEGTAPNGERYNSRLLVKGTSDLDIKNEIHLLEKHEWGAKKLVDVSKKETDNGVIGVLYIVDNHKYGMWRPWKDEAPISKPFSWG